MKHIFKFLLKNYQNLKKNFQITHISASEVNDEWKEMDDSTMA